MKKLFLMAVVFAAISVNAQSDYSKAIGVRVSPLSNYDMVAASFKTFLTEAGAIELNAGFGTTKVPGIGVLNNYGTTSFSFSGAYQHHFDIAPVEGLKWFVGGGAVVMHTSSDYSDYKGISVGAFPTGGVDYKFKSLPLNVTADYRPTFLFVRPDDHLFRGFLGDHFGISARYTF